MGTEANLIPLTYIYMTTYFSGLTGTDTLIIKGRWPLVPQRQGYMVRLNFETTVN